MVVICDKPYPTESESKYQEYFDLFPYDLSDFQKYSIEAIVTGNDVLCVSHTGCGKTLCSEAAILHFVKQGKKVIYTAPIKAISNQRYYEFTQRYPEISFALITGDIKINPSGQVLIMTAEILMNYLLVSQTNKTLTTNTSFNIDIDNELACVVMDEVHFINDRDRGQTWEKTILALPSHITKVMLSATLDSPERFAQWCEDAHPSSQKQVWLTSTYARIVPLTHYGYLVTPEAFYKKVRDKAIQQQMRNSTNRLIELKSATEKYNPASYLELKNTKKLLENNEIPIKRNYVLNQLCTFLKDRDMFPAIAFVFSRKNVELYAKEITANLLEDDSKIPYTMARDCEQIVRKLPNYQEYLTLPEYTQLVTLLEKGVGIHHSGMIPILREIVELMISQKRIKLLFATESFAIGLNCPIRTAIFTSLTKFDGNYERLLYPHEYNQAASRCGRRNIDTVGHVVHCNNLFGLPTDTEYRVLLCGKPQRLTSKFRISLPLVLTLLRTPATKHDLCGFVEKSMIQAGLIESARLCKEEIAAIESDIEKHKAALKFLRTPQEICQEYNQLVVLAPTLVNKKRKEAERKIQQFLTDYRYIKEDVLQVNRELDLAVRLQKERENLCIVENHITNKIQATLDILYERGFIVVAEYERYELTKKGQIASMMAEINPIVLADFLQESNDMENLSTIQIIQFLSCFTDIKVLADVRAVVPSDKCKQVHNAIKKYTAIMDTFLDYKNVTISGNGTDSDLEFCYDLMDIIEEWCAAIDEPQCKWFIQTQLGERGISVGDFTKAVLKISTITRELMNVCEAFEKIELLSKLAHIDGLILKYITTAQSLYI